MKFSVSEEERRESYLLSKRLRLSDTQCVNTRLGFKHFLALTEEDLDLYSIASIPALWAAENHAHKHPHKFPGGMVDVLRNISLLWKISHTVIDTCLIDRVITILADLRVPLQVTLMQRLKVNGVQPIGYTPHMMAETIADAFVRDWVDELVRSAAENSPWNLMAYLHDDAGFKKAFLGFVKQWGRDYGKKVMPSQDCINYCRTFLDNRWKYRKYGESVTTVFMERFVRDIAWARRYRYVAGLDKAYSGRGMIHVIEQLSASPSSSLDNPLSAPETILSNFTSCDSNPSVEFEGLSERAREYLTYTSLTDYLRLSNNIWDPVVFAKIFLEKRKAQEKITSDYGLDVIWNAVPGIVAFTFLENLHRSPDAIFILMLQAFMESESHRSEYPLLSRGHPAYRKSPKGIAARRKGTPDYLEDCPKFGWFHMGNILLMQEAIRDDLISTGNLSIPAIPHKGSGIKRNQKYLGEKSLTSFQRRQDAHKEMLFASMEIGGRMSLATLDIKAIEHNYFDGTNSLLFSPSVRATRHAFANKNRPLFSRMLSIRALRRPAVALQCMGKTEWLDFLSGMVSPETIHSITRAVRNEFLCGYSHFPSINADRVESEFAAYRILAQRLRKEASLTFFHSTLDKTMDVGQRRLMAMVLRRNPWSKYPSLRQKKEYEEGVTTAHNVAHVSFNRMMYLCKPLLISQSQFLVKQGLQNEDVFALWKMTVEDNGFAFSNNFLLDYACFVSRLALWSRPAFVTMTKPELLQNMAIKSVIPVPFGLGEQQIRMRMPKDNGIQCDILMDGKSICPMVIPTTELSPIKSYLEAVQPSNRNPA